MAPKNKRTASVPVVAKPAPASTVDLTVGEACYSCLCTRDPEVADDWAARVLKNSGESKTCSAPGTVVSLDCEWAAPWHRGPGVPDRLATLQISHNGPEGMHVLVFSVVGLNGKLPPTITSLLGDARVAKVGANLAGDATRVVRDFGCPVRGVFDLSRLNAKPGKTPKKSISLEAVVKANCPQTMHVSKAGAVADVRTSNWENWPLSDEQVLYASQDVALGLLAFMCKFDMYLASSPELSKVAIGALVDLVSVDAKASEPGADMQKASTKVMKRPAASVANLESVEGETSEPGSTEVVKKDHAHFFQHMRSKSVKPPNLGTKEHPKGSEDALAKVCIVVSGTLDSFERSGMEEYVKEHGGKVSKTVTAKVTHLVTDHGEAGPSKLAKCKELGIPVVSEDVILKMVGGLGDTTIAVATSSSTGAKGSTAKPSRPSKRCTAADETSTTAQGRTRATKTVDPIAVETTSSASTNENTKKRGRPSKQSPAADESSTGTLAEKAKPSDPVKAIAGTAEPAAKKRREESASCVTTPVRKRMMSADKSVEVAGKDVAELAATKSQTAKGAKKHMPKEIVQLAPAASAEEASAKTPGTKKDKNTKADADINLTPPKKACKKSQASEKGVVEVDAETLIKSKALSMQNELMNLAGRPELQGKGFSAASLMAALEKTNGLVNPAKRLLLGE